MPLELPNLDDRNFSDLRKQALNQIQENLNTDWSDLTPGDPGIVLLEVFAALTDTMLYRLNRLPEKAYIAFLRLLGVNLFPPTAASVDLSFTRDGAEGDVKIPRFTRVATAQSSGDGEPIEFITNKEITLHAGRDEETVTARNCTLVREELLGYGTGEPGLTLTVQQPPILVGLEEGLDLAVAVEMHPNTSPGEADVEVNGKPFRYWHPVSQFDALNTNRQVYQADRQAGIITFAPAARMQAPGSFNQDGANGELKQAIEPLGAIPPRGREIRIWYPIGGGPQGNVTAHTLTNLVTPIDGIAVTNPQPATGGDTAESLANALIRGPQELTTQDRALTATDFERLVQRNVRSIARARAYTKAERWTYAQPGTVAVGLVLAVQQRGPLGRVTAEMLRARQRESDRIDVRELLEEKQPLGTTSDPYWVDFKEVWVEAEVDVHGNRIKEVAERALEEALHKRINPLANDEGHLGWPFGQPLWASDVYRALLNEPGVQAVRNLTLHVAAAPDADVFALAADYHQPHTWYAGSGRRLFRSFNDGAGWEIATGWGRKDLPQDFTETAVTRIKPHPELPGLVAVLVDGFDDQQQLRSFCYVSLDCGERWARVTDFSDRIRDMAWFALSDLNLLLLATDSGLYVLELHINDEKELLGPVSPAFPVVPEDDNDNWPLYAITVVAGQNGERFVVVSSQRRRGVFIADGAGLLGRKRRLAFGPLGVELQPPPTATTDLLDDDETGFVRVKETDIDDLRQFVKDLRTRLPQEPSRSPQPETEPAPEPAAEVEDENDSPPDSSDVPAENQGRFAWLRRLWPFRRKVEPSESDTESDAERDEPLEEETQRPSWWRRLWPFRRAQAPTEPDTVDEPPTGTALDTMPAEEAVDSEPEPDDSQVADAGSEPTAATAAQPDEAPVKIPWWKRLWSRRKQETQPDVAELSREDVDSLAAIARRLHAQQIAETVSPEFITAVSEGGIRQLAVQYVDGRYYLWLGTTAIGGERGNGCLLWDIERNTGHWFTAGWQGGSCRGLAFQGSRVLAATHSAGLLWLDIHDPNPTWRENVAADLPRRSRSSGAGNFQPILALATNDQQDSRGEALIMTGFAATGVLASADGGQEFFPMAEKTFLDRVTLPQDWLFVSGEHTVKVNIVSRAERIVAGQGNNGQESEAPPADEVADEEE